MNQKEVKKSILSIMFVSIFLILMTTFVYLPKQENLLSSFAFLQNQRSFYMEDVTSGILKKDASPMSDEKGFQNEPYRFKVINHSNEDITYQIVFQNNEQKALEQGKEVLPNHYLRYSLQNANDEMQKAETLADDGILYTAVVKAHSEETYDFRMWLDYDADNGAMNKIFIGKIEIVKIEK